MKFVVNGYYFVLVGGVSYLVVVFNGGLVLVLYIGNVIEIEFCLVNIGYIVVGFNLNQIIFGFVFGGYIFSVILYVSVGVVINVIYVFEN